jgi:hypothetical protein
MEEKQLEPFPCLTARFYGYNDTSNVGLYTTSSTPYTCLTRSKMASLYFNRCIHLLSFREIGLPGLRCISVYGHDWATSFQAPKMIFHWVDHNGPTIQSRVAVIHIIHTAIHVYSMLGPYHPIPIRQTSWDPWFSFSPVKHNSQHLL